MRCRPTFFLITGAPGGSGAGTPRGARPTRRRRAGPSRADGPVAAGSTCSKHDSVARVSATAGAAEPGLIHGAE